MTDYNVVEVVTVAAAIEDLMPRSRAAVFAAAVKRGRERLAMSQDVAAEKVGVRQQTWSGWEKGVSIPPPRRVATIAEVLKLDVQKLQQAAGHIAAPTEVGVDDLVELPDDDVAGRLNSLDQRTEALMGLLSKLDGRLDRIEAQLKRRPGR